MTPDSPDDSGVLTRRALREIRGTEPNESVDAAAQPRAAATARWVRDGDAVPALTWVDAGAVAASSTLDVERPAHAEPSDDLLAGARRRGPGAGVLVPVATLAALVLGYSGSALLWPLDAVPPEITAGTLAPVAAPAAQLTWPAEGSAAIGVSGTAAASSTTEASLIASITKVVSVLMVLDEMPLQPGEDGPSFEFTRADSREYWRYVRDNQSALDVPAGGSLTEHQMLQGILLGSANNYIDRLAEEIWGSDEAFAEAAESWLATRNLDGITVVTPAGRDERNTATPQALTRLADIAMSNPVFAEIVGTRSVDLPGAGTVRNSNGLLADPGFVGVKTGTLRGQYNLLSAKDVDIAGRTVRLYAAVLGQPDNATRLAVSRTLYSEVEAALAAQGPVVDVGTVVGEIDTVWGESVDIVTDADARVVLWNGASADSDLVFDLDEQTDRGDDVGRITVTGPLDSAEIPVSLADDLDGPTAWWRLTHPIELFGMVG